MCQYEYNISNGQKIVSNINIDIGHYFLHIAYVIFILTQCLVPVDKCNATCFFLPSKINKLNVIHVSKRGNHHPKKYILDYILNISVLTIFITFLQSEKKNGCQCQAKLAVTGTCFYQWGPFLLLLLLLRGRKGPTLIETSVCNKREERVPH